MKTTCNVMILNQFIMHEKTSKYAVYMCIDFNIQINNIQEEFEDTTVNTMAKVKKYNWTNNYLQNSTYKTKDRVRRIPLNTGVLQKGKQFLLN